MALACRAKPAAGANEIVFAFADQTTIRATMYRPAAEHPPAIVLLHMLGSDRHSWDPFARAAVARGYMTLAIDLRRDGDAAPGSAALDADAILAHDIGAAVKYLLDNGADPDNLFIAGASIGANLALHYAVTDPRIQAVILLSPGEDYRGVRVMPALDDYTQRPLLIMASEGDSYSAATARKMQEAAESQCELRIYPGSAHGTDILNAAGNATGQIFLWLEPIVQR